jgi:hypothetical protein
MQRKHSFPETSDFITRANEAVYNVMNLRDVISRDLDLLRKGLLGGSYNAQGAYDMMNKTCETIHHTFDEVRRHLTVVHDPNGPCLPSSCHTCLILGIGGTTKEQTHRFELHKDASRRALSNYGVHNNELIIEYRVLLERFSIEIETVLWILGYLKFYAVIRRNIETRISILRSLHLQQPPRWDPVISAPAPLRPRHRVTWADEASTSTPICSVAPNVTLMPQPKVTLPPNVTVTTLTPAEIWTPPTVIVTPTSNTTPSTTLAPGPVSVLRRLLDGPNLAGNYSTWPTDGIRRKRVVQTDLRSYLPQDKLPAPENEPTDLTTPRPEPINVDTD